MLAAVGRMSIMTKGLIDFMAIKACSCSVRQGQQATPCKNLLGVAALALWLIFSTIARRSSFKTITTGT